MKHYLLSWLAVLPLAAQAQLSELSRDTRSSNLSNGYALAPLEAARVQGTPCLLPGWVPVSCNLLGMQPP